MTIDIFVKNQIVKQESWLRYIKDLPEVDRIVKIKNYLHEEKIFTINVKQLCKFPKAILTERRTDMLNYKVDNQSLEKSPNKNLSCVSVKSLEKL